MLLGCLSFLSDIGAPLDFSTELRIDDLDFYSDLRAESGRDRTLEALEASPDKTLLMPDVGLDKTLPSPEVGLENTLPFDVPEAGLEETLLPFLLCDTAEPGRCGFSFSFGSSSPDLSILRTPLISALLLELAKSLPDLSSNKIRSSSFVKYNSVAVSKTHSFISKFCCSDLMSSM